MYANITRFQSELNDNLATSYTKYLLLPSHLIDMNVAMRTKRSNKAQSRDCAGPIRVQDGNLKVTQGKPR